MCMKKEKLINHHCIYCKNKFHLVEIKLDHFGIPFYVCQRCIKEKDEKAIAQTCEDILRTQQQDNFFDHKIHFDLTNDVFTMTYTNINMRDIVYSKPANFTIAIMGELDKVINEYKLLTPNFKLRVVFYCYESNIDSKILNKIENYLIEHVKDVVQCYEYKVK